MSILELEDHELWLKGGPDAADNPETLLRPFPPDKLQGLQEL